MSILKIAIVGAECSGKSTLCTLLAKHYNTIYVPEYACEYLSKLTNPELYTLNDIQSINIGQLQSEHLLAQRGNKLLVCDTSPLVNKVWAEVKYGICPTPILQSIVENTYDYYFLASPDFPWENAPFREHPNDREELFLRYKKELLSYGFKFEIIHGTLLQRMQQCTHIINATMGVNIPLIS